MIPRDFFFKTWVFFKKPGFYLPVQHLFKTLTSSNEMISAKTTALSGPGPFTSFPIQQHAAFRRVVKGRRTI